VGERCPKGGERGFLGFENKTFTTQKKKERKILSLF
jgi:hypothetical protein